MEGIIFKGNTERNIFFKYLYTCITVVFKNLIIAII